MRELCRKRGITQEFPPADSPKSNSKAKRALALINDAALAARIQATRLQASAPPKHRYGLKRWRGRVIPFTVPQPKRILETSHHTRRAMDHISRHHVGPDVDHLWGRMRVLTATRPMLNQTPRHLATFILCASTAAEEGESPAGAGASSQRGERAET